MEVENRKEELEEKTEAKKEENLESENRFHERLVFSVTEFTPKDPADVPMLQCMVCGRPHVSGVRVEMVVTQLANDKGEKLENPIDNMESLIICPNCYMNNFNEGVMWMASTVLSNIRFEGVL